MGTVDTQNPNPDTGDQLAAKRAAQQTGRARPARPRPPKSPAPLIGGPGDDEVLLDMEASVVMPAGYRNGQPAAPPSTVNEPANDLVTPAPPERSSAGPSQTAEEFIGELDKTASAAASLVAPSQSGDALIEELKEIEQGSRAVGRRVTGTAQLPANTPTRRSKPPRRVRGTRAPRAARAPRLTRVRARKTGFSLIAVLVLVGGGGGIVLTVETSSPPARAASAGLGTPTSLVAAATKAVDPFQLLAATVATTVEKQAASVHARAPHARKKPSHQHRARAIKHTTHTAGQSAPSTAIASQVHPVTTTPAPAAASTASTYRPVASTKAPSQPAGPTGFGSAGNNCNPQCK
jgi:hypothetical protein